MKYVFFGTPRFASLVLAGLLDKMPPQSVVTNPDRPAGRKKVITPPAVKALLMEKDPGIELLQPERPKDIIQRLKELEPDLFVVAAYGKIIPQAVLDIPRLGTIGVHPSLLPRYRGATPIQSAILGGEERTGVSLYMMDAEVDHGPILAAGELPVDGLAYPELEAALATLGARLLLETMPKMLKGEVEPKVQDHELATFTAKFDTQDGFIAWEDLEAAIGAGSETATTVWRKIRAFDPEPGAWTIKGDARIKLLAADLEDGKLVLRKIQRAGKNPESILGGLP